MLAACHSMSTSGLKLLVVEDDPDLRTFISAILTTCGYGVRSSSDGLSALKEIRAEMPDIVLSDLFMPGMSGFELLSVIRCRFPGIQVVAMSSAYSGGQTAVGLDADAFYEKATNFQSLLAIIEEVRKNRTPFQGISRHHGRYGLLRPKRTPSAKCVCCCPVPNACALLRRGFRKHPLRFVKPLAPFASCQFDTRSFLRVRRA